MNEVEKVPSKIAEVIKESKINDLTLAEKIASGYSGFLAEVQEQIEELKTLEKGNAEDCERARRIAINLGRIRSRKNDQKKIDKDYYLVVTRFIDSLANTVEGAITMTQQEALEISKFFERQEEERKQKLKESRWLDLSQYMESEPNGLGEMDESVFTVLLSGAKKAHEDRIEAEKKAEEARIEAERLRELGQKRREQAYQFFDFIEGFNDIDFAYFSEEEYEAVIKEASEAKEEHLKEQERVRLENERLKKEAEDKERLRKEEEEKEAERIKSVRLEFQKSAEKYLLDNGFEKVPHGFARKGTVIHPDHFSSFDKQSEFDQFKANVLSAIERDDLKEKEAIEAENRKKEEETRSKREKELRPYISFIRDYNKLINSKEAGYKTQFEEIKKGAEDHWEFEREQESKKQAELDRMKAELEADRKQKEAEEQKKRDEEEARIKAEEEAKKAPDRDKIVKAINELVMPELDLSSKESNEQYSEIIAKFNAFKEWAKKQVK